MILNYKYEIYPTEEQEVILERWINICRQQYNSTLLDKSAIYKKTKKNYKRIDMQKQQTADKKLFAVLKEVPSQPLQEVFFRLEKAFDKFFRKEAKYPKLKTYKNYRSLTFTQFGIGKQKQTYKGNVLLRTVRRTASLGKGGKLQISGVGLLDIVWHRKLDGRVKQVVIKHQGNRWFAIFSVERQADVTAISSAQKTTGIDVGIKKFAVLSNGQEIQNPTFLRKSERTLARAQRRLSRMKKHSKNWWKQLSTVRAIHEKVANQRKDFLHKASYRIAKEYSVLCVEDLQIRNMIKNRKLAKSIQDAGWGMFRSFLQYKCERFGGFMIKVKPHFTSQDCSSCGERVKKSLSIRTHVCTKCGTVLDRDHNAALNIEKAGLQGIQYNSAS